MPVVLPHDEDVVQRLRSARQSVHYFQHNLAKLQELGYRHVVLCDGKVVGGGPTREAADAEADRNQAPPDRRIRLYVPQPGESYFY